MNFEDLIEEIYFSLSSNKIRSFLTILGIVIGISSVIAMISIGEGAKKDIQSNIESLGTNLISISPGAQRSSGSLVKQSSGSAQTLTVEDAQALESISSIELVSVLSSSREQVVVGKNNANVSINGIDENYFTVKNLTVSSGQEISQGHINNVSKVIVITPELSEQLFDENVDSIGKKIKINNQQFTIIGITEETGQSFNTTAYIPITTLQRYILGNDYISSINVKVKTADLMDLAQAEITSLLLKRHNIASEDEADFSIMNQADMIDAMSSITETLTILLGAVAGISLVVGGIGIMNMMLTNITERTKEIGLRKSLGAENKDISLQFLSESIALTLIGGIAGIILGILAGFLITKLTGTTTFITSSSIILAFGISALIGIVFGYYPSMTAAKLNPINALRYE